MTSVAQLLAGRRPAVFSIAPAASAYEALALMAAHDLDALPVVEGTALVGILTQRDFARKVGPNCGRAQDLRVADLMTPDVLCSFPEQSLEACLALMTAHQIDYLPVLAGGRLVATLSIRDIIAFVLARPAPAVRLSGWLLTFSVN